jgi:hypothetical protein
MIVQTTLVHGASLPYAGLCSYRIDMLELPPANKIYRPEDGGGVYAGLT